MRREQVRNPVDTIEATALLVIGVIIGAVTLFDPEHSAGPIGLIFAICCIVGPLRYLYIVWCFPHTPLGNGQHPPVS